MNKQLVTKDNSLIGASYSLGLVEQRLIFLAIIEAREQYKQDLEERAERRKMAKEWLNE